MCAGVSQRPRGVGRLTEDRCDREQVRLVIFNLRCQCRLLATCSQLRVRENISPVPSINALFA